MLLDKSRGKEVLWGASGGGGGVNKRVYDMDVNTSMGCIHGYIGGRGHAGVWGGGNPYASGRICDMG